MVSVLVSVDILGRQIEFDPLGFLFVVRSAVVEFVDYNRVVKIGQQFVQVI